jgi:hypothetical protein
MINAIVGNTGLIGKTLSASINFDYLFNSLNIDSLNNSIPLYVDNLYLSCLPAQKYIVNKNIVADIKNILRIIDAIGNIKPKKVFLVSTIDVYCDSPFGSDEDTVPTFKTLTYGSNRYFFEKLVIKTFANSDVSIFRLPGLFGNGIKKNIIYDILNNNNISKINTNSSYQWYDLNDLVKDICLFSKEKVVNLFTEPIETNYLMDRVFEMVDCGVREDKFFYDFRTKYSESGYIRSKDYIIEKIKRFKDGYSDK